METLEQHADWEATFRAGWLAYHQQTGEFDWKRYNRPRNAQPVAGWGIPLATSRIILISSAGGYLSQQQAPFDAANPYGDYSIRLFPLHSDFAQIAFAHDHFDHTAVNADLQVLLPLRHLTDLEDQNWLGEIAPQVISFMGYQPDVSRVLAETIPAIINAAQASGARGALLVPA